jgi:hypothetical protein
VEGYLLSGISNKLIMAHSDSTPSMNFGTEESLKLHVHCPRRKNFNLYLASVAVGISCTGPLGGKQGFQPYPSGPSQHRYQSSLGHLCKMGALTPSVFTM